MAKMRPIELPLEVRNEPFRKSEILVYDALSRLSDSYNVLYGVTWYLKIRNNTWSEGEADFVVVAPNVGIVIIEVKGGRIGRDEEGWYSVDRNDEKHRIKDPTLQASNCKHKLIECIKKEPEFSDRFIPARHMVCFTNVLEEDAPTLIDTPREMQILANDLDNIEEHIVNFANRDYDGVSSVPLSPAECSKIVNILKPNFDCPNRWSLQAERQNRIMDSLTEEQSNIWNMLDDNDRIAITGPAGSGKTVLALKYIKKCLAENLKVLAILPSKSLCDYYKHSVNSDKLITITQSYENINNGEGCYDVVVIDESQDLSEDDWLTLYDNYNIESSIKLLCVFDSNQKLRSKGNFCPLEKLIKVKLSRVIRNTKEIAEFSSKFYSSDIETLIVGPKGLNVQFTEIDDSSDEQVVPEVIAHYVLEEGFDYSDIVVLFANDEKTKFKKNANNNGNKYGISFRSYTGDIGSYSYKNPIVLTESVFRFRGLESKIIILVGLDKALEKEKNNACYIGASRARNILHIVATKKTIKELKKNSIN